MGLAVDCILIAIVAAGLNHYTSEYIQDCPQANNDDKTCTYTTAQNGTVIGPTSGSSWLIVVPQGFM